VSAEPCAYCCYAIRESRIGRVVYGLRSPHMGGVSKWPVLPDEDLSNAMPEVFAPPPEIVAGFMAAEAEEALLKWNPMTGGVMKLRGLFVAGPVETVGSLNTRRRGLKEHALAFLRRAVFDRFGRT
jgi:tRNA(adenine34) deaminase